MRNDSYQCGDQLTGIGNGNLVDFIGIQPDFVLSAAQNGRSEPLLQFERDHLHRRRTRATKENGSTCPDGVRAMEKFRFDDNRAFAIDVDNGDGRPRRWIALNGMVVIEMEK